ncbi:NAD+ synthase [Candidatus Kinetoplastidibacterium crithidiae]|uniref:Glutamine-dependent NAD(+) synthetase n=1 Tax=Candidatus Kinetoplastidibacterium crithidiae TCC036E TaxID=1208918 RepID=M1LPJ3_9PROT|nr:NAD+ synthase [Candidatus Kinetoplastibacterium crithidii]AFZ82757.1 NAD synthetase [Candidatus Kinetoplastibacterium crithidii (ex Angomonas deanei ATCC 30255)]AGF47592.1 glutamine-hydrolysing NAD+ synthase [Candidatus Kinetoplastibacterium crithidii TCC036E]
MNNIKIAIAQINSVVGDIEGNTIKLIKIINESYNNFDLLVTPELVITGYPPEDLLFHHSFIKSQNLHLEKLRQSTIGLKKLFVLVGHVHHESNNAYNVATLFNNGAVIGRYYKSQLPNYSVFDEKRYFSIKKQAFTFNIKSKKIGIMICEDLWVDASIELYQDLHVDIIVSLNASPFFIGKDELRYSICKKLVNKLRCGLVYVNAVGGQDELIFDGGSFFMNSRGLCTKKLFSWKEDLDYFDINVCEESSINYFDILQNPNIELQVWNALVLSLRDYINKNNFPGVIIGLSGGIDSALALTLAVDAIGSNRVQAIMMSTCYTSEMSIIDADILARRLNVEYNNIDINKILYSYNNITNEILKTSEIAKENIQARIRGNLLMAISNTNGNLVVTTGNKSEIAMGYCTLYGDMVGGFALLKDISKTMVYKLSKWRNRISYIIPDRIISRAPSAELKFDQTDQDTLPPYDLLDEVLELYIEKKFTIEQIIDCGYGVDIVNRILELLHKNEYKRSQSPIGPKITSCSFGCDWRYPITNSFYEKL